MKMPPPVRVEELEGMDFELEEDMKKREGPIVLTTPGVDVPRTPKNALTVSNPFKFGFGGLFLYSQPYVLCIL